MANSIWLTLSGGGAFSGQQLGPAASNIAAPPFSFLGDLTTGYGSSATGVLDLVASGTSRFQVLTTGIIIPSANSLGWGSSALLTPDVFLARDAANILAQRNGTAAQIFKVYNTYTDGSNNEPFLFGFSGNVAYFQSQANGTGTVRGMVIGTGTGGLTNVSFQIANTSTKGMGVLGSTSATALSVAEGSTVPNAHNTMDNGAITQAWKSFTALQYNIASLAISGTAPTVTSAGTSPSVTASNGTVAFRVNVGTGGTATTIVLAMPAATTGWNAWAVNITGAAANRAAGVMVQQASTTTSITLQYQTLSTGVALAFTASDIVAVIAVAF